MDTCAPKIMIKILVGKFSKIVRLRDESAGECVLNDFNLHQGKRKEKAEK